MFKTRTEKLLDDNAGGKQSYPARLQFLCREWTNKWEGPHYHSQQLTNRYVSGYFHRKYAREHTVNLLERGVQTIVSYLVEGDPRVVIEPGAPGLRAYAYNMQLIVNFLIAKYKFAQNVLIPGAVASMFGEAIARTFYAYDRIVSVDGEKIKVGSPRVALIEPCDYVGDPSAKRLADFAFEGDMYRLPTEYAKDLFAGKDRFGNQLAGYIEPDCKLVTKFSNEEVVARDETDYNKLALEQYSTFIDVFDVKSETIVTIMPMGHKAKILKEIEWTGPDSPYDHLGYRYLDGVPVPIPPAWSWYDLDVTMNKIAQVARQQSESQKDVLAAEPASKEAAEKMLNARNTDVILVKGANGVQKISLGGANPENYTWMQWAEGQFTRTGAATSGAIAGRGPQADTLGQEQLIFSGAKRVVDCFYGRFHDWMTSILRKWVWAVVEDPTTYVEVLDTVNLPGIGTYERPVYFSSADKVADFYQLLLKVELYSTQRLTPELKYQRLYQMMTSWFLPSMQLRAQQGTEIDLTQVDSLLANYAGMDTFPQWYRPVVPTQEGPRVDYFMKPNSSKGQGDDRAGATPPSREQNSLAQQSRLGYAGELSAGGQNATY
jgi:hypothetical protein